MAEEQINDFLLDQELEPDDIAGNELPDDIDAILDAVEDEDISTVSEADVEEMEEMLYSDESGRNPLDDTIATGDETNEFATENDLDQEVNIAAGDMLGGGTMGDDSIPLLGEVIDPNNPPSDGGNGVMTLGDDMMFEIMAKIQHVVEQSVNNEIGKLASTVRDNVVQDVKDQLPGVLSEVLKGGK
jgi:hypothetical protein